jgi:hypothetical protein
MRPSRLSVPGSRRDQPPLLGAIGSSLARPRTGNRARGLQRRRRRLALLSLRRRALTRLPLEGGRLGRPLRSRAAPLFRALVLGKGVTYPERADLRPRWGRRAITARTLRNTGGLSTPRRPTPGYVGVITIHKPISVCAPAAGERQPHTGPARNSSLSTLARSTAIDICKSLRITPRWHRMMS